MSFEPPAWPPAPRTLTDRDPPAAHLLGAAAAEVGPGSGPRAGGVVPPPAGASDAPAPLGSAVDVSAVDVSVLDRIDAELAEVDAAIGRLDDGSYGRCEVCRAAIEDAVLAERPAAQRCRTHLAPVATAGI